VKIYIKKWGILLDKNSKITIEVAIKIPGKFTFCLVYQQL